ncbi:hypothetical protein HK104_004939 [Borealophlyctis nickersoniae]|nr:hypothetical protein HK104_004939 [Borealophlyctis nickersoniae]
MTTAEQFGRAVWRLTSKQRLGLASDKLANRYPGDKKLNKEEDNLDPDREQVKRLAKAELEELDKLDRGEQPVVAVDAVKSVPPPVQEAKKVQDSPVKVRESWSNWWRGSAEPASAVAVETMAQPVVEAVENLRPVVEFATGGDQQSPPEAKQSWSSWLWGSTARN